MSTDFNTSTEAVKRKHVSHVSPFNFDCKSESCDGVVVPMISARIAKRQRKLDNNKMTMRIARQRQIVSLLHLNEQLGGQKSDPNWKDDVSIIRYDSINNVTEDGASPSLASGNSVYYDPLKNATDDISNNIVLHNLEMIGPMLDDDDREDTGELAGALCFHEESLPRSRPPIRTKEITNSEYSVVFYEHTGSATLVKSKSISSTQEGQESNKNYSTTFCSYSSPFEELVQQLINRLEKTQIE